MYRHFFIAALLVGAWSLPVTADDTKATYETEIEASVEAVWKAFTRAEGLSHWMAPLVEIELKVGGKMRSNYNPEGKIGDATTIESTILAFDPQRMLALKATGFPEGFPFEEAAAPTWSVFYFAEPAPGRTRVTVVGLGYSDDPKSQELRGFFSAANKASFDKLKQYLADSKP